MMRVASAMFAALGLWAASARRCDMARLRRGMVADGHEPWEALVLHMLIAALEQGASIPRALQSVGGVCGGAIGMRLVSAAHALHRGARWRDSWPRPDSAVSEGIVALIAAALEPSWEHGDAAVARLAAAIDQMDERDRSSIEQSASRLSVRLLLPIGLCFLPAFVLIGVIPSIVSLTA